MGTAIRLPRNAFFFTIGLAVITMFVSCEVWAAAPANDNFANAQVLTGTTATATGTNVGAAKETGEPNHAGYTGGKSVWYRWTAPADTDVEINTFGSNFDTLLGVYTGTQVNALTLVASNDEAGGTNQSRVVFTAVNGTTYQVAVDGYSNAEGNLTVNLNTGPRVSVAVTDNHGRENSADTITFTVTRTGATTAPLTVNYTFANGTGYATAGTDFSGGTNVVIPAGSASAPVLVTPIDDNTFEGPETVQIQLAPAAGYIVDPVAYYATATLDDDEAPLNDNFAGAKAFNALGDYLFSETNINATAEAGEPLIAGSAPAHTVWYSFTPAATTEAYVEVQSFGSTDDSVLGVFTGSAVNALTPVASNDDIDANNKLSRAGFIAQAGVKYYIAVDGYGGTTGNFEISLVLGARVTLQVVKNFATEAGTTSGTINIVRETLDNSAALQVNVSYAGTATNGTDYDALPTVVTIPAGSNTATLTIHPIDDNIPEGQETMSVSLNSGTGYNLPGTTYGTVTIYDNDPPPPNDFFANATPITGPLPITVTGANGGATSEAGEPKHDLYTPSHSVWWSWVPAASGPVTIDTNGSTLSTILAVYTGTAITNLVRVDSDDFASTRSKVAFIAAAGTTYYIAVDGYSSSEGQITLNLIANSQILIVSAPDKEASETGPNPGTFMIRRGNTTGDLTVNYFLSGSASSTDYTATPPSPVTIPNGVDNVLITITPVVDALTEGEETVTIFPSAANYFASNSDKFEFIRIIDAQTTLPEVTVTGLADAAEAGLVPGAWRISRTGPVNNPLVVSISTSGGTSGSDFVTVGSTATIPAGQTFVDVPLIPIDDAVLEGDESISLIIGTNAAAYTISFGSAAIKIRDDERPPNDNFTNRTVLTSGTVSATGTNVNATVENGEPSHDNLNPGRGTVWWSWTAPSNGAVTLAITGGSPVYSLYTGTTLAGLTRVATTTTSPLQAIVTSGTTYQIGVDRAPFSSSGSNLNLTLTFSANLPIVDLTVPDSAASEENLDPGMFLISRTGDLTSALTVNFTVAGTATAGSDYTSLGTSVTIPAGQPSVQLPVNVLQDTAIEGNETVIVTLSSNAAYVLRSGSTTGTVTIADNDTPPNDNFVNRISLGSNSGATTGTNLNASKEKGEPNHYSSGGKSVWWSWTAPASSTVRIDTNGSSFDTLLAVYTGTSLTQLTKIAEDDDSGNGSQSQVIFDCVAGTTYQIAVDGYSGASGNITLNIDIGAVVMLAVIDASAAEQGQDTGTFRITRVGQTTSSLTVNLAITGTATNGTDYQSVPTSVSFLANETQKDIVITPIDDTLQEGPETVILTIQSSANYFLGATVTGTVTIADNDFPVNDSFANRIVLNDATPGHAGNNANGTTETGEPNHGGTGHSIWYAYTPSSDGVLNINTSTSSFTTRVAVYTGSAVNALTPVKSGGGTLLVAVTGGVQYQIAVDSLFSSQGTVTTAVSFTANAQLVAFGTLDTQLAEAGLKPGSLVLTRQGSTTNALVINIAVTGTATAGADYQAFGPTLTIPAGQSSVTVPIIPIDDSIIEVTENIIVNIQANAAYVIEGSTQATFTLTSDDLPTNDNFANRITLTGQVVNTVGGNIGCTKEFGEPNHAGAIVSNSVWWTWTAPVNSICRIDTIGTSFDAVIGVYTGSNVAALTLVAQDDNSAGNGQARVQFTATAGTTYQIAVDGYAQGTIALNLVAGQLVTVTALDPNAGEPNDTGTFRFTRGGDTSVDLTVNFAMTGTAVQGTDYTLSPSANSVTFTGGATTVDVTLTPLNDSVYEDPETAILTIQPGGTSYTIGSPSQATVTIADDDLPDLQVTAVMPPANAYFGAAFVLNWITKNNSANPVPSDRTFTERVYLSSDGTLDGNDLLLGSFPFTGGLAGNQSVQRAFTVTIPSGPANGNYRIIVQTDATNALVETVENNNTTASTSLVAVAPQPLPDLVVENVMVPPMPFARQTIAIQYTVRNIGTASTDASSWIDQVFLSVDQALSGNNLFVAATTNPAYLAPGESYTTTVNYKIPIGLAGQFYIQIYTDKGHDNAGNHVNSQLKELNEGNNLSNTPIQIQAADAPNLKPSNVNGPEAVFSGEQISVSWTVSNAAGPNVADVPDEQNTWSDAVYLSDSQALNPGTARLLGSVAHTGVLKVGESYTQLNRTFTVPEDLSGPYYIFVLTDSADQVYEGINNFDAAFDPVPLQITLTPPPDLVVTTVDAPNAAVAGRAMPLNFTIQNQGPGDAFRHPWVDAVYLSQDQTLNTQTDILIGRFAQPDRIAAGASYTRSIPIVLPNGISGPYYVFVVTDVDKTLPEFNAENNNTAFDPTPVQISFTPPDLQLSEVLAPAQAGTGQFANITWTVVNAGTGGTIAERWHDRVYISASPTLNVFTAIELTTQEHSTGELLAGGTYSKTAQVRVPKALAEGTYYFYVQTDVFNTVNEFTNENNNVGRSLAVPVAATTPDLRIVSVNVQANANAGQTIPVTWQVDNPGTIATFTGSWQDSIYLSDDNLFNPQNDLLLAKVLHQGDLAVNDVYNGQANVRLPFNSNGSKFIFVVVDTDDVNAVYEGANENNNSKSAPLTIAAAGGPDLQVTSITIPATAVASQSFTMSWTVTNTGPVATDNVQWTDYIYLSLDQGLDNGDILIRTRDHSGPLAAGLNYQATDTLPLPNGLTGNYYVIVVTDKTDRQSETNEQNNIKLSSSSMNVAFPQPVNLSVSNIVVPANGAPGATAPIQWTVTNSTAIAATGSWDDSVFLSQDPIYDSSDILIQRVTHNGGIAPMGSYTGTTTVPLPAAAPGSYYVIVRTDARNVVRETNENDNTTASTGQIAIDIPALTLGTPVNGQLSTGSEMLYKVTVPAGQPLIVSLDSASTTSANELYIKFGDIPTRNNFDQQFTTPFESDQQVLVPSPVAGTYFILVRGDNVPGGPANYSLVANLLTFSVRSISPNSASNLGQVTTTISGARFSTKGLATLLPSAGAPRPASQMYFKNSSEISATFDLRGLTPGLYSLRVDDLGRSATLPDCFTVTSNVTTGNVKVAVSSPASMRSGQFAAAVVEYQNQTDVDQPAPLLVLSVENANLRLPDEADFDGTERQFMGLDMNSSVAGTLAPGARGAFVVLFKPTINFGLVKFELRQFNPSDGGTIDLASLEPSLRPEDVDLPTWLAAYNCVVAEAGSTTGSYVAMLDKYASIASQRGDYLYAVENVFVFAILYNYALDDNNVFGRLYLNDFEHPLGGVQLSFVDQNTTAGGVIDVFQDGTFAGSVEPGTFVPYVKEYLTLMSPTITVVAGTPLTGLEVIVTQGASISGKVRDTVNHPLAGLTVSAVNTADGGSAYSTEALDDGTYKIKGLPAGSFTVRTAGDSSYAGTDGTTVTLTAGQQRIGVDFTLELAAVISGTVVRASNQTPIEGALIVLNRNSDGLPVAFADSDASGKFTLSSVPSGAFTLSASCSGFVTNNQAQSVTVGQQVANVQLPLAAGATVNALVREAATLEVLEGAEFTLSSNGTSVAAVSTDVNGSAIVADLPGGNYVAQVAAGGYLLTSQNFTLAAGGMVNLTSDLNTAGTISGTVMSSGNTPLAHVEVTALDTAGNRFSALSANDGTYKIEGLLFGTYAVELSARKGAGSQRQNVTVDAQHLTVSANFTVSGANVSGIVFDSDGITPLRTVRVTLSNAAGDILFMFTEADGGYAFQGLAAGSYQVEANDLAHSFATRNVTLTANQISTGQNFVSGTLSLSGKVTDNLGAASPDAAVTVRFADPLRSDPLVAYLVSDADGRFQVSNLLPGAYIVAAIKQGYARTEAPINIAVSGPNSVTVAMQLGYSINATVRQAGPGPVVPNATVLAFPTGQSQAIADDETDNTGTTAVSPIPNGTYDVWVFAPGFKSAVATGVTVANGSTSVTIDLPAVNTSVSGMVTTGGNGLALIPVQAIDSQGRVIGAAITALDGSYSIQTLPAGTYSIRIGGATASNLGNGFTAAVIPNVVVTSGGSVANVNASLSTLGIAGDVSGAARKKTPQKAPQINSLADAILALKAQLKSLLPQAGKDPKDPGPGNPKVTKTDCIKTCFDGAYKNLELTRKTKDDLLKLLPDARKEAEEVIDQLDGVLADALKLGAVEGAFDYFDPGVGASDEVKKALRNGEAKRLGQQQSSGFQDAASKVDQVSKFTEFFEKLGPFGKFAKKFVFIAPIIDRMNSIYSAAKNRIDRVLGIKRDYEDRLNRALELAAYLRGVEKYCSRRKPKFGCKNWSGGKSITVCSPASEHPGGTNEKCPPPPKPKFCPVGGKKSLACCGRAGDGCDGDKPPDNRSSTMVGSPTDPNEKTGPIGSGANHVVGVQETLPYTIYFENVSTAAAPAQRVRILDQLDPNLDERTFRLGSIYFSDQVVDVPANRSFYQARMPITVNGQALFVDIAAGLDIQSRQVFWSLTAIDPATGDRPIGLDTGFLPPNDATHRGEGHVVYTVKPKATTPNGAQISNVATIIFDELASLDTNSVVNTVDTGLPSSKVDALPVELPRTQTNFTVTWTSADANGGSGLVNVDVYVSDNNGPWTLFVAQSDVGSADFAGEPGHSYRFYSLARDKAGNVEAPPATADAETRINGNFVPAVTDIAVSTKEDTAVPIVLQASDGDAGDVLKFTIVTAPQNGTLSGTAPNLTYTPAADFNGSDSFTFKVNDGKVDSNIATVSITITAVNDAPKASDGAIDATAGVPASGTVKATDVEKSPLKFALVSGPGKGSVQINPDTGAFTYTPNASSSGDDSFTFKANDGELDSNIATVKIKITGSPALPVITSALAASGIKGQTFSYRIEATGGVPITFTASGLPAGLALNGDTISGTPASSGQTQVTLTATNAAGSDTKTLLLTIAHGDTGNKAPVFASAPTATPNPAKAGQAVQFAAQATDSDDELLGYTWEFGDASTGTGAAVQHVFAAAGLYDVVVKVTDGTTQASATVTVVVNDAENATDPNLFKIDKFALKLVFMMQNMDNFKISGTVPVEKDFAPAGKLATFVMGTVKRTVMLDAKGKGSAAGTTLKLTGKLKDGKFETSPAKFTLAVSKASLADAMAAFGLRNETTPKQSPSYMLPVALQLDDSGQAGMITVIYKATKGKSGSANLGK